MLQGQDAILTQKATRTAPLMMRRAHALHYKDGKISHATQAVLVLKCGTDKLLPCGMFMSGCG